MKNLILILLVALSFSACQQKQRYTQQSTEIDKIKELMRLSNSGEYEAQRAFYADGAQLFYNATESNPMTIDQVIEDQKSMNETLSNVSTTVDDNEIEMVITDNGETYVNLWGTWKATFTATGQNFEIPFHSAFQFVDGKIVREYGYWDSSPIMKAFMEYEASQKTAADSIPGK
jgi:hypothetical protein